MIVEIKAGFEPHVHGRYDEDEAQLTLRIDDGRSWKAVYDEDEVDRMLRVIECSGDPVEELYELFEPEFGAWAYRVARHVLANAKTLSALVYE